MFHYIFLWGIFSQITVKIRYYAQNTGQNFPNILKNWYICMSQNNMIIQFNL